MSPPFAPERSSGAASRPRKTATTETNKQQTDNDMLLRVEKVKLENRDCSALVHTLRGSLSATQSC